MQLKATVGALAITMGALALMTGPITAASASSIQPLTAAVASPGVLCTYVDAAGNQVTGCVQSRGVGASYPADLYPPPAESPYLTNFTWDSDLLVEANTQDCLAAVSASVVTVESCYTAYITDWSLVNENSHGLYELKNNHDGLCLEGYQGDPGPDDQLSMGSCSAEYVGEYWFDSSF
jgi:hypothetical protein